MRSATRAARGPALKCGMSVASLRIRAAVVRIRSDWILFADPLAPTPDSRARRKNRLIPTSAACMTHSGRSLSYRRWPLAADGRVLYREHRLRGDPRWTGD